ncbi:hypothetical protein [Microbacterium sp. NPDC096154]|uniref:hypothetical protein n=1 Tax=Microbacterium sp. NPDC096154 TaxID=3155549 RepID=UPI00331EFF1C
MLTLNSHGSLDPGEAALTLLVTVFGTLSVVFTADLISHLVAHDRLMTAAELRHAAATTFEACH